MPDIPGFDGRLTITTVTTTTTSTTTTVPTTRPLPHMASQFNAFFDETTIHPIEMQCLPEFFDGRSSYKTPEVIRTTMTRKGEEEEERIRHLVVVVVVIVVVVHASCQ